MKKPFIQKDGLTLYVGDALKVLSEMPDESVNCVVTSPPYYGLRDYGVEGQIGMEAAPEDYIRNLVNVFRETHRVLRSDGTFWLNMGDSYARNPKKGGSGTPTGRNNRGESYRGAGLGGLPAKNLMGIPWRVALDLQRPFYGGKILSARDRLWVAAMVEAEGCIYIHKRKAGTSAHSTYARRDGSVAEYVRKQDTYGVGLQISNTSLAIIDRLYAIVGKGSRKIEPAGTHRRRQTLYTLSLTNDQARGLLREIYPDMVGKRQEARVAFSCPSSGQVAAGHFEALKVLHRGGESSIDGAEPPTLFEPGFILRNDICWVKPNAMPEGGVRDRLVRAHEYVFLFAKSQRYFFDSNAIVEPAKWERWGDQTTPKHGGTDTGVSWIKPQSKRSLQRRTTKRKRTVWTIPTANYEGSHFAVFPNKLVEPCVLAGCPEGGVVLDPFIGSGTTAVVALNLNRTCVGIELDKRSAKLCAERIATEHKGAA